MHNSFVYGRQFAYFCGFSLLGILFGFITSWITDFEPCSWMLLVSLHQMSIVKLLSCSFPLLMAAYAVSINQPNIIYFLGFVCFYFWSIRAGICVSVFGSAAWLLQPMLQFSESASLLILSLFCANRSGAKSRRLLIFGLIVIFTFVIVSDQLILPFVARLIGF